MKKFPATHRTKFGLPAVVVTAALMLSVTACSPTGNASASGPSGDTSPGVEVPALEVNQAAVDLLPESIKASKVLRVAIPTNEPPTQYYREGTQEMIGTNPDVARLIGEALGVKVDIQVANFDSIIPGLAADRYDMTVSSMTPTEKRMEVLDFVDYMQVGTSIAVPKGNPIKIDEKSLCGKKVAVLTGSYQLTVNIPAANEACDSAGKEKIQISEFQDTRQAISALSSGRQEAVMADSPVLNFAAKQNPQLEIAATYDVAPVAVGVPKDTALVKSVSAALNAVITSESYGKVLGNYGLESSAITDARVNVAQ